jgi:hypothetical protein
MPAIRFRRRPLEIEAVRFDGINADELRAFAGCPVETIGRGRALGATVFSPDGVLVVGVGLWLVRGRRGFRVALNAEIMRDYEAVDDGEGA